MIKKHKQAVLFDFNRTIFNPDTNELYPYAREILSLLYQKYDLYLVSKIELDRLEKLKKLGINNFFAETYFIKKKTEELFEEILGGYDKKKSYVVGDLVENEISIGIKIKTNTIWLRQGKFKDIKLPISHEQPTHTIQDIREIENIIV